jgi:hypothetical protein
MQLSLLYTDLCSFRYMQDMVQQSYVSSILSFLKKPHTDFYRAGQIYTHTSSVLPAPSPMYHLSSPTLVVVYFFMIAILTGVRISV